MSLATLDDLKRNLIYAGGKISFGDSPRNTMTETDAQHFLDDAYAIMELTYEYADATSDEIRKILIRIQCLETYAMILNAYNIGVEQLKSIRNEIDRLKQVIYNPINYAIAVGGKRK